MNVDRDRQLTELLAKAEAFRRAMIESGAVNKVSQHLYIDQLRALEAALQPLNYIWEKADRSPAQALASIPDHLYWLMGKGRTKPSEPLYAVQLIDPESGIAIVEAEAEQLADAIDATVKALSRQPKGAT